MTHSLEPQYVYVLCEREEYSTEILGVFSSLKMAKSHPLGRECGAYDLANKRSLPFDHSQFFWSDEGWHVENHTHCVSESRYPGWDDGAFIIFKLEVQS
jgi:hypothetical protein